MKKALATLLLSAAALSLCLAGCGDSDQPEPAESEAAERSHRAAIEAADDPAVRACEDFLYGNAYVGVDSYVALLSASAPGNSFASAVSDEYGKIGAGDMEDLEADLLNAFALLPKVLDLGSDTEIGRAWCAGYEGMSAASDNRLIVVEVSGTPKKEKDSYPYWVLKTFRWPETSQSAGEYGFTIACNVSAENLEEIYGIDVSAEAGECEFSDGYGSTIVTGYVAVEGGIQQTLYEDSKGLLSLLGQYYDDVYKPGELREEASEKAEAAAKNAEPEIGMTKSEVLNGAWGEPDEKNVDEYAWGTSEQWVYDDHGYVYFENGIVNAIQHR